MLKIGSRVWKFVSAPGRLFYGRDELVSLISPERGEVAVSDKFAIEQQLEAAAETAIEMYKREQDFEGERRAEFLRAAGYDFTIPSAGPLKGIPLLRDVRWSDEHEKLKASAPHPPRRQSA